MAILKQKGSGSFRFQMVPMLKWNSSLLNFVFDGNKISFYHSSDINMTYFCVSLYIGVIGSFRIFFTAHWSGSALLLLQAYLSDGDIGTIRVVETFVSKGCQCWSEKCVNLTSVNRNFFDIK